MSELIHSYGPHELQKLKIFKTVDTTKDAVVFIHGGGWRDPNNTYDDFKPLINHLSNINVISLNYRLSPKVPLDKLSEAPQFQHPRHLIDVIQGLKYVQSMGFNIILLVGHSVGSSLILQLLNYDTIIKLGIPSKGPDNLPSNSEIDNYSEFMNKIQLKSIHLLDGIYDVKELLIEYPDYKFFVNAAFENDEAIDKAFQLNIGIKPNKLINEQTIINIIYSLEDELITINQSNLLKKFLDEQEIPNRFLTGNWGLHEEIYKRREIAEIILKT